METKLSELIERCRSETERYARQGVSDTQACWEIWRRAVEGHDNGAWQAATEQYNYLVRNWLRLRIRNLLWLQQDEDWLVNATFFKFYRAVDRDKFKNFANLAALLRYLQFCCSSVANDEIRAHQKRRYELSLDNRSSDVENDGSSRPTPNPIDFLQSKDNQEQEFLAKNSRSEFWQAIQQSYSDPTDLMLIYVLYVLGIPPRDITRDYPQFFPNVKEVYRRRKNILSRLRNNPNIPPNL